MARPHSYDHTQRAPLHYLLHAFAVAVLASALAIQESAVRILVGVLGLFFVLVGAGFAQLRVRDRGDHLELAFGPLTFFRRRFPYDDMLSARAERSRFIDGWGIHYIFGRGWIYNLWGYDCVAVERKDGKRFRIGTDDPNGLLCLLERRIEERASEERKS